MQGFEPRERAILLPTIETFSILNYYGETRKILWTSDIAIYEKSAKHFLVFNGSITIPDFNHSYEVGRTKEEMGRRHNMKGQSFHRTT